MSNNENKVTNVVVSGLGGQGVIRATDILSDVVYRAGFDVKKSELHGLSQRGGSVSSDVRFGKDVFSPMVPEGEADFLLVLADKQLEPYRHLLRAQGAILTFELFEDVKLPNKRSVNVALLGSLSAMLDIDRKHWVDAICSNFPQKLHDVNIQALDLGAKLIKDKNK